MKLRDCSLQTEITRPESISRPFLLRDLSLNADHQNLMLQMATLNVRIQAA